MAIITKKEFASLCDVSEPYINTYISRKKLALTKDGKIDTTNELNFLFLQKRTEGAGKSSKSLTELEREKKELDIEKTRKEVSILETKYQKLKAEVIPVDLVKSIFFQHSQSITFSFKDALEDLIIEISKKKSLNGEQVADIRGKVTHLINKAVNDAIERSKKIIHSVQSEYSEKRNPGEKK